VLGGALAVGVAASQGQPPGQTEGGTQPATVLTAPPTAITITPDAIDCTEFTSPRTCRTTIVVRGGPSTPQRAVTFGTVLARGDGDDIAVTVTIECSSGCSGSTVHLDTLPAVAVRLTLELPEGWRSVLSPQVASGFLGVDTENHRFESAPKRLRVLAPSPSYWQWMVILVPGVLALIVVTNVATRLKAKDITPDHRMGSPSWKASESWSSNLTVGAGLVTGVLALTVITDLTVFMTTPSYAVLSMLLAAFVLLAPIVYGISRRRVAAKATLAPAVTDKNILIPQAPSADEFEGTVRVFLVAGALTLWASGGQLVTFALLMVELWRFRAISGPLATVVAALSLFVLAGLLHHGFTSMLEAGGRAKVEGEDVAGREGVMEPKPAPPWNLL
jgi:hypothetical protein